MIMDDILSKLTSPQQEAASHIDGPMLVLAGPGSGKTRVITHRVAYMIQQGIAPWNILAITFTNKAAQEMRERLTNMQINSRGCTMSTFHALAVRLLREFPEKAGLTPQFTIYDVPDQKAAIREAIKLSDLDTQRFAPAKMLNRISVLKNDLVTPDEYKSQQDHDYLGKSLARIYSEYQNILTKNNAVDFDDLLMKLSFLLKEHPDCREQLNQRYKYILVDEYQDTNQCQYQIARGLSLNHNNLFVTGDPDQSIYAWRGADISNILAFEEDYPNAKVVRLEENFRSTPEVLTLADSLISQNTQRKEKALFTSNASGVKPVLKQYADEYEEADGVAEWLKSQKNDGIAYKDMAVFYRVNAMSRVLEQSMRKHQIPYQIVRGVEFFQRKEIKDMLAYLKYVINPSDQISFKRIINVPARGIGATSVNRLLDYANEHRMDMHDVLMHVDSVETLGAAAKAKIKKFYDMLSRWKMLLDQPIENIIKTIYIDSGLKVALESDKESDHAENVDELINSGSQYDMENLENDESSLEDYLQQIALVSDIDSFDETSGAISLMTLHSAKGLEFPAVAIIGLEEGILPHSRSLDKPSDIEEERRLLFVGITRSENVLTLSYARNRTVHGSSLATIKSEFLRNLTGLDNQDTSFEREITYEAEPQYDYEEDQTQQFYNGQLVRHPKLGMGRIQELIPSRENAKVIVQFNTGSRKTLILKYANLETLD